MKIDACFQLGYITGTHGLSGDLHILLDTDQPENYHDLESVFILQKGEEALVPFFISKLKIKEDKAIARFEEVNSKDLAKQLVGSSVYLPLDQLPKLEGDSFYYHELLDWKVIDQKKGEIGIVQGVNVQSPQPLLILAYQNKEILVPFSDDIIIGINRDEKQISVELPDGLLEVYLEP